MKNTPEQDHAQKEMQTGHIVKDGMLGNDTRKLADIIAEDAKTLARLNITKEQIADRLEEITELAVKSFGSVIVVDGTFEVYAHEARAKIPCPWPHPGLYPKVTVFLQNIKTGEEMEWSSLLIHTIREHGFFEGKGAFFRLEPEDIKRILEL